MSNYTKSTNFATKDNLTPGDPLKIVRGTEIDTEFNNIATAIATKTDNSAAAITGGSITGITDLAIADGGTGASTATAAINNLLPSQTSNANKYLQTDGTNVSWDAVSLSTSDITGTLPVANGGTGVTSSTGTGSVVLSNSPTLVTPALGTPSSATLTNATGLPISTGVSGLGTGVATALGVAVGSAGAPVVNGGALGTPSSGTVTNLTGTASININGTVGATTPTTGAFTTVAASSSVTLSGGTANGVTYLNGSKVLTSGSALTFDGSVFGVAPATGVVARTKQLVLNNFTGEGVGITFSRTNDDTEVNAIGTANSSWDMGLFARENILFAVGGGSTYSATTEGMRLTSTGLGIGTSSPTNKLTVDGNANITGNTTLGDATTDTVRVNGYMGVGGAGSSNIGLYVRSTALTGTTQYGVSSTVTASSSATTALWAIEGAPNTPAESFSVSNVAALRASNASKGAGSTITNQHGVYIADQTQGTNNYGITSLVSSGTNKWNIYASGTADNYFAGNLGLGVTPSAWRTSEYKAVQVGNGASFYGRVAAGDEGKAGFSANAFYDQTDNRWEYIATNSASRYDQLGGGHYWYSAASGTAGDAISFTQAMTLDASGQLLVGKTASSQSVAGCELRPGSAYFAQTGVAIYTNMISGTGDTVQFRQAASPVGSISVTASATAYNTSSDYRLKNTIAPMTGALAKVAQLKPVTYKWNVDGSDGEGFIAHELAEVCPNAVNGEKDAVDEEGNPKYQGIDTSFLVATVVAALQELKAEFDAYKASHP